MFALPAQAFGHAGRHLDCGVAADGLVTRHAILAMAAEHRQAGDHMVTGLDVGDVFTHRFDDTSGFMAEYGGHGGRVFALDEMQVAVAQA
eukprot:gene61036-81376_t